MVKQHHIAKPIKLTAYSFLSLYIICCTDTAQPLLENEPSHIINPLSESAKSSISNAKDVTAQDILTAGQKTFAKCRSCHTLGEGDRHKIGPNLWGVMDTKIASKDDFFYSKAFKASAIVWTDEALDEFLTKPRLYIPGNRMSFVGIKSDEEREALIAYLRQTTQ